MRKISGVEVAQIMLDENKPLSIREIIAIAAKDYPNTEADVANVGAMVRHFVESVFCSCLAIKDTYPHKYHLKCVRDYIFRIRRVEGINVEDYSAYRQSATRRREREKKAMTKYDEDAAALRQILRSIGQGTRLDSVKAPGKHSTSGKACPK